MGTLICANCQAENPEGARFCNKCGDRFGDAFIDPRLEDRLLERIEARLKDNWLSKDVVEKEIALNAATRFSEWAKLFAIALALPAAILGGVLAFFGIRSTSDLRAAETQAVSLKKTATDLEAQYKPLQDELPRLTQIASAVHQLENRVEHVESEVARFAPSNTLPQSTQKQLKSVLVQYSQFLSKLGLNPRSIPTVHVEDTLPEPGYNSYIRGNDIFVRSDHARPGNVLREYSHAVLDEHTDGDADQQWAYSAIEAGLASYLTADFLKSPVVDEADLSRRFPISNIPHTWQGGQDEGSRAWGSFLWALRKQFRSKKTSLAAVRAWGAVRLTSPPGNYQQVFLDGLVSAGLDASVVKTLLHP